MAQLTTKLPTESWITIAWEQYLQVIKNPIYHNSKSYYYRGNLRIEMLPVEEALRRNQQTDQSEVLAGLMSQF